MLPTGLDVAQDISFCAEGTRQRIYEAIQAVGQPGGSCLWHAVGLEETLKDWALGVRVSPESASGVLIGALGWAPSKRTTHRDAAHACGSSRRRRLARLSPRLRLFETLSKTPARQLKPLFRRDALLGELAVHKRDHRTVQQ
jgi:hypothetical protein